MSGVMNDKTSSPPPESAAGPAESGPITPAELARMFAAFVQIGSRIPAIELSSGARMTYSANLFIEGPRLVQTTAQCLEDNRALFPDIPTDPADLRTYVQRALGFSQLRDLFLLYAQRARDCYIHDQCLAVQQSMDVLRHVRADGTRVFPMDNAEDRAHAMAPAEGVLDNKRGRKKHAEMLNRLSEKRFEARRAAGKLKPPKKGPSPQARAIAEFQKESSIMSALGQFAPSGPQKPEK